MARYSVKELTDLSGVSIRTLHHYDKIGLLKPAARSEAGYRYYGERELLRLQQILFYRELEVPLKEIRDLLDDPDFDLLKALRGHREVLKGRRKRTSQLIRLIDHTITQIEGGTTMTNPKELYEGLPEEYGTTLRSEAIDEYGQEAIDRSERELVKLGKAGFKALKQEMDSVIEQLFSLRSDAPESAGVQDLVSRHYAIVRQFWGTSNMKDNQAEAYAGLGQLYVQDERFLSSKGEARPDFAAFMSKAMANFASTELGLEGGC